MKKVWYQHYPSDWRSDPLLKLVSRAARSFWLDCIGLMHESGTHKLEIQGRAMTVKEVAGILGDNPRTAKKLLNELIEFGVCDVLEGDYISSRRVLRDLKKAEKDKLNGRKGGNPALKTRENDDLRVNLEDKAQNHKPKPYINDDGNAREDRTEREDILIAMGHDKSGMTAAGKIVGNQGDMIFYNKWKNDLRLSHSEICQTITETMSKKRDGPPATFSYFNNPMQKLAGYKRTKNLKAIEGGNYAKPTKSQDKLNAFISGACRTS